MFVGGNDDGDGEQAGEDDGFENPADAGLAAADLEPCFASPKSTLAPLSSP